MEECPLGAAQMGLSKASLLLVDNPLTTGVLEAVTKRAPPGIKDNTKGLHGFLTQMMDSASQNAEWRVCRAALASTRPHCIRAQ